jgi:hypothetical protein
MDKPSAKKPTFRRSKHTDRTNLLFFQKEGGVSVFFDPKKRVFAQLGLPQKHQKVYIIMFILYILALVGRGGQYCRAKRALF